MMSASALIASLNERGLTVATGESLTGGAVCAALVDVPGASAVVRGGIVAYTVEMKVRLLGLDPEVIARAGVVSEEVALAMAAAVRRATGADLAVATTGVAGPEPHGGLEPGTVCVAVVGPGRSRARTLALAGDRAEVRSATVAHAIAMVAAEAAGADAPVTGP